ncbi:MAG: RnfABCDGE type electron transport complex subunit D [Fibrobacter sp.]|nr:RnfABCDGE type electron transport complex subunit D [Fibrobacter sp.]
MTTPSVTRPKPDFQSQVNDVKRETVSLHISSSPHIRHGESVRGIMLWVIAALIPSLIASVIFFGFQALFLTSVSVISAVLAEWLISHLLKRPSSTGDFSAVVTGLLLAYNVSPLLPWWMVAIGSVFAIGVAKMAFGGLGGNFINPALAGRAFLMASYPAAMTSWKATGFGSLSGIDGITSATPLEYFKSGFSGENISELQNALGNLFIGNVGGCIGETSVIALLIGAMLLWYKKIIGFRIPLFYIGTVFFLFWIFNGSGDVFSSRALTIPLYQILSGGLMLGALFMATDMVTSPITPTGKIIFALGCGILTFVIRKFGGYPEGVSYSILLMNLFVPHIERYTKPRIYGEVKKRD